MLYATSPTAQLPLQARYDSQAARVYTLAGSDLYLRIRDLTDRSLLDHERGSYSSACVLIKMGI